MNKALFCSALGIPFFCASLVVSAAQTQITGEMQCGERLRAHYGDKRDNPFKYRVDFVKITDGNATAERSGKWAIDTSKSFQTAFALNIGADYILSLTGQGYVDGKPRWRFALKGQGSGNANSGQLTGSLFDAGDKGVGRNCTYSFTVKGGTLADAAGEKAKLAQQRRDLEAERARLAGEQARIEEQRRSLAAAKETASADATRIEEERNRLAAEEKRIATEKKRIADRQKAAAKAERQRAEADKKRDAAHAQLASNQQTLQKQQASTDRKVEGLATVLGSIVLPRNERANDWIVRAPSIPVQQQQFCRIIDKSYDQLAQVYKTRNEIKRNSLYKDRQQDVAALLPNGVFQNWLVRLVEVTQAPDGSAAVVLQLPCRVMLGSDPCARDATKPRATIAPESPAFRELQRLDTGSFVVVSGRMPFAAAEGNAKTLPSYAMYQPGTHCSSVEGGKQQDIFTTEISYLVQMR